MKFNTDHLTEELIYEYVHQALIHKDKITLQDLNEIDKKIEAACSRIVSLQNSASRSP